MLWLWERIADGDWARLPVELGARGEPPAPHGPDDLGSPLSCDVNAWLERQLPGFDLQLGCALCIEAEPGSLRFSDPPGPRRGQERGVVVGVDRERWRSADLAGRRGLALEALIAAIDHAAPALSPQLPALRDAFRDEANRWQAMRRQAASHLSLPPALVEGLTRDAWLARSPAEREAAARVLEDALREAGLSLSFDELRQVHPDDGPVVAGWRDADGRAYVLVPGCERFAAGHSAEQIDRAFPALPSRRQSPPGQIIDAVERGWLREELQQRPPQPVAPLLLAAQPERAARWGATWPEVASALAERDAQLPTAAEWEWALRGEREQLYPWGDEPPESNALEQLFADAGFPASNSHLASLGVLWSDRLIQLPGSDAEPVAWPLTSRAGLLRPQAAPTWSLTDDGRSFRRSGGRPGEDEITRMLCARGEVLHELASPLMTRLQPCYRLGALARRGE